ncbi:MAG: DUF5615 family PIN-like protein [Opitutales bacterium]|nr:DUF5615 family PIN-like protein [Opitutales bacterium]
MFSELGHPALHTLELPLGNKTPDQTIAERADQKGRVVVSIDLDFLDSHLITGNPSRLLLVSTGNTSNERLQRKEKRPKVRL